LNDIIDDETDEIVVNEKKYKIKIKMQDRINGFEEPQQFSMCIRLSLVNEEMVCVDFQLKDGSYSTLVENFNSI